MMLGGGNNRAHRVGRKIVGEEFLGTDDRAGDKLGKE